jgi:predicted regulator of amino acid metabolism with ACT domain
MVNKTGYTVYLPYQLGRQVEDTHKLFAAGNRRVSRNDVFVQLVEDGFRYQRRETQAVGRIEVSVATMADRMESFEKLLRSILLTLAEGDTDEVERLLRTIEKTTQKDEGHHA